MFTKEDILARLQNGDSMDAIAKEMSETLNAAQQQYQEETIKANAEKLEAERVMNAKRQAVDNMLDCLCDYLVAAGEEEFIEELKVINTDEMIETIDSILAFAKSLESLKGLEFPLTNKAYNKPKVTVKMVDPADADMVIKSFLKGI